MNLTVTGNGSAGSWKMRGEQVGNMLRATLDPRIKDATNKDLLVVKKFHKCNLANARSIVWDVVDCYPQPEACQWSKLELVHHIERLKRQLNPDAIIAATRQMAEDLDTPYYIYHHGREYSSFNPIRETVTKIGYEGDPRFLGEWRALLERECRRHGWEFVINPKDLRDVDILVALRGKEWTGYASRNWKSNVKLANAQTSGTPIILNREAGYIETASGGEEWADEPGELIQSLEFLKNYQIRKHKAVQLVAKKLNISELRKPYEAILKKVASKKA